MPLILDNNSILRSSQMQNVLYQRLTSLQVFEELELDIGSLIASLLTLISNFRMIFFEEFELEIGVF
jgi:hypothetical protein